jgi:hypothetical protein
LGEQGSKAPLDGLSSPLPTLLRPFKAEAVYNTPCYIPGGISCKAHVLPSGSLR